jgi:hypothetical protein
VNRRSDISDSEQEILIGCLVRAGQLASNEPPAWAYWEHDAWLEEIEHGPRYGCGAWFGDVSEARRMRFRRAIDSLAARRLLVPWRAAGRRLTHVRLTKQGERVARRLAAGNGAATENATQQF